MTTKPESWIESSDVVSMFPTFVWNIQLRTENTRSVNAKILKVLNEMRGDLPTLAAGQAWQSTKELHELDAFRDLVIYVHGAVRRVLEFLRIVMSRLYMPNQNGPRKSELPL